MTRAQISSAINRIAKSALRVDALARETVSLGHGYTAPNPSSVHPALIEIAKALADVANALDSLHATEVRGA